MDISRLSPFRGLHSSLIAFSSGHIFRISIWSQTPTEYGAFSNLWMVTPEGRRILFADPPDSGAVVCIYHNFDEVLGAKISTRWPGSLNLVLTVQADNGTSVEMELHVNTSLSSKLLEAMSRRTHAAQAATSQMMWLGSMLSSKLIARGRSKSAGHTDTGQPYLSCENNHIWLVVDGSARLNANDIGQVCPAQQQVTFGDLETAPQAFLMDGALYLAYDKVIKPQQADA